MILAVETAALLAGLGTLLAGIGGLIAGFGAWRKTRQNARDEAEEKCSVRLRACWYECENLAAEIHRLRMNSAGGMSEV